LRQVSLPVVQTFMMVHNKTGYGVNFHQFLLICATIGTPLYNLSPRSLFLCLEDSSDCCSVPPPRAAQGRSLFQWRDPQRSGRVTVTLDQLLELVPFPLRPGGAFSLWPSPHLYTSTCRLPKCHR
jgi:hypothetical protein